MRALAIVAFLALLTACQTMPEDPSAYASEAGQSTIVLGACESGFNVGWGQCLLEKGSSAPFPTLRLILTNPGEWAVSDCELGLFKTGAVDEPGIVDIPLAPLKTQLEKNGFCILKIEATEKHKSPQDSDQIRSLYMRGGFFLEMVPAGYFPVPSAPDIAFCVKVERTTKGRTKVEKCSP